jgi:streptogramin lyase
MIDLRTGEATVRTTGVRISQAKRGGFDPFGNAWFGGAGTFLKVDGKTRTLREYWPAGPYSPFYHFYEVLPDKNGEVWAGVLHGRGLLRFNPAGERWTEYVLAEPYGHDRRSWIDNSTTPVTFWYPDYSTGYIVRVQARE